MQISEVGV